MITTDSVFSIGRLGKTHGLRGEMLFFVENDVFVRSDADFLILLLDGIFVPFYIEEYRFQNDERALIKFDSIDTLEQAAELTNAEVFFPKNISSSSDTHLLPHQLIGFAIYDTTSKTTTTPISTVNTSSDNPLFELSDGTLIPIAEEWFKNIDNEKRIVCMTLPEGLLTI